VNYENLLKVKGKMSDREVRRTVWWEWTQRAAAILFIPLLTLLIWQNWKGDAGEVAEMMEVKTSPGMTTSLTLPDGTIVYLNSESSLSYPSRFNGDLVYDSETDKVHLYKTSGKSELAWKDGEVVLDNTPLEEALWMLEKRYSVKFVIKNEKLKNSSFTGTFTNQRLEKILEYFKVSSKIRWQHINDDKDGSDRKKEIIEIY